MGIKISMEFLIGLIITLIVLAIILVGCNRALTPKCDLRAMDAFEAFNTLYKDCMNEDKNNICNCGEFDIKSLPPDHKILLTPYIEENKEKIRVSLVCNGRNAKNDYLENLEGDEKVKVYVPDPINFEKIDNLAMLNLRRNMRDNTNSKRLSWIYTEMGDKIRNNEKPYISEEILGNGFEIENTEITHYVKNVGLLLGVNEPLTLLNLNGNVAFMAKTKSQKGKVSFSNCV